MMRTLFYDIKFSESVHYSQAEEKIAPRAGPPISPQDLAVVVDTMIQGLGRYLRCCGVDVKILENSADHDAAAQVGIIDIRVS